MANRLQTPDSYHSVLSVRETERAIEEIEDFFQVDLARALNLRRVTAPLFVESGTGINDDLNGVERPVTFTVKDLGDEQVEVVQSLAKWKRLALADLAIPPGEGICTDMNAIRPDETLDDLHSIHVDQWDWERVLTPEERHLDLLKTTVRKIYEVIRQAEAVICARHPALASILPPEIAFVHSEDLQERFPHLPPAEREKQVAREHGAVFVIGIGWPLGDGKPHDGRAPDYDDWTSANGRGHGLNGDILIWYPLLETAFELSSMGIRVTPDALRLQLAMTGQSHREALDLHQRLLSGELPLSIGGGIGQSRLCTLLLKKAHIGEIQAGIWPADMRAALKTRGVILL